MSKYLIKKTLVFVIIILFIGAIITPCISGNVSKMGDIKSVKTRDINNAIQTKEKKPVTTSTVDWWPMFRHDSGNTGSTTSIAPYTNHLHWKETISDEIYSAAPVIYNDRLYISTGGGYYFDMLEPPKIMEKPIFDVPNFTDILNNLLTYNEEYNGGVYCLDADKGTQLWNYPLYSPNDPLIVDNKVYVTDLDPYSYNSYFYCINAENGNPIWNKSIDESVLSPTIGVDGKIFLGCFDYFTYYGSLKCYDFDGNNIWSYPIPNEGVISASAYCNGKVYFITLNIYSIFQGNLYCLNADTGEFIWSQPVSSFGSPVCKDGRVFAIDFDFYSFSSKLMCFNADTGVLLWDNPFGGYSVAFGTPAVSQDSVFIYVIEFYSYFMGMYKFFVNGTLDWKVPIPGYIYMFFSISPVCSANKVFICSSDYYGYNNINTIYCMEIENGNILWSYNLDDISMVDLSIADERVYTADYTGNIYSFEDILKIKKISGGILCVKAEVKNNGESDFTNLSWDIDVVGGIFDMINKSAYGNIPTLQAGKSKTVRAFPVFGLGNVEIEVKVSMPGVTPIRKSLNGLVLGLIVIVKS